MADSNKSRHKGIILYANMPYNSICISCDKRSMRGTKATGNIDVSFCDECFKEIKLQPIKRSYEFEADTIAAVRICLDRVRYGTGASQ